MKGWKNFSPLVEINPDLTLQQLQDGLVEGGIALRNRPAVVHLDADAVCAAIEEIKSQLENHPEDISDRWVTAHVKVGKKTRFISKRLVCQVSMSIFFICQLCFMCMCSICLSCLGNIAGNPRLRACVVSPLQ
jgi:hypothetical protein